MASVITVLVKGPEDHHLRILREFGALDRLAHERHLFTDLDAAIAHARSHLDREPASAVCVGVDQGVATNEAARVRAHARGEIASTSSR